MNPVTYRESCGTPQGAAAHQRAGEPLCGWCAEAEAMARLHAEMVPSRPTAVGDEFLEPVTAEQAQANQELLDAALNGVNWIADQEPAEPTGREAEARDAYAKTAKLREAGVPVPVEIRTLAAEHERSRRQIAARADRPKARAA